MMDTKKAIYQCTKCLKISREPMKECPNCGCREISKTRIVETK